MPWSQLLVLALAVSAPSAPADAPPREEPRKPAAGPESEALPGKLRLALDPGRHTNWIDKVLFTPDGRSLIVSSRDRSIAVWDVLTGQRLRVLRLPGRGATSLALSPDGRTLAAGFVYRDGETTTHAIALLALEDGRIGRLLRGHTGAIQAVAFSPDGKRLASGARDNTVRLWDLTGKEAPERVIEAGRAVFALAFSPDGTRLVEAAANQDTATVRDLASGQVVASLPGGKFLNWFNGDSLVAWSPDGRTVATCGEDGVRLWEPGGKLNKHLLRTRGPFWFNVAFSPDSRKVIVVAFPDRVLICDVATGKVERSFTQKEPRKCVFSPDGKLAATAGWSDVVADGRVQNVYDLVVWNLDDGKVVWRVRSPHWLSGAEIEAGWSADGKTVAWRKVARPEAWKGGPTAFDVAELRFTARPLPGGDFHGPALKHGPLALTLPNLRTVAVLRGGKPHAELKLPNPDGITDYLVKDPLTLVGKDRAAVLYGGYSALVFDVHTGKLQYTLVHGYRPVSAAGSPDGRYLLTLAADQVLRVWAMDKGKLLLSLFVSGQDWIAWTAQGYYAASPAGESLMGWVVDNGIDQAPSFYPAQRFRKQLYRPDVIQLLLEKGSFEDALAAANAARKTEGETVAEGTADLEQLLPPRATLRVVETALPKVKVKATAEAAVKGQPVTGLRLLVDGRPLPDGAGVLDLKAGQEKVQAEWEVELPPGAHELKALARAPDTAGASAPVALDVPAAPAAERPTLHLIAVGIDDYPQQALQLRCAAADARGLAGAFGQHCAGPGNLFGAAKVKTLLNGDATRTAILGTLKEVRGAVRPGDLLVFSFAGHGVRQGKQFYLLTADADPDKPAETALSGDDLRAALADLPCQVLLLLDACHSAAGVRAFIDEAARNLTGDECAVAVLCAAMGYEEAREKDGHGLFTRAVMQALEGGEGVPFNRHDRRQYVHHLGAFVLDKVQEWSAEGQHPFLALPYVTESFPVRQLP